MTNFLVAAQVFDNCNELNKFLLTNGGTVRSKKLSIYNDFVKFICSIRECEQATNIKFIYNNFIFKNQAEFQNIILTQFPGWKINQFNPSGLDLVRIENSDILLDKIE